MKMLFRSAVGFWLFCGAWLAVSSGAGEVPTLMRGVLGIHDPSTVIECNGRYYVFGTGQGIISRSTADKTYWTSGPSVFVNPPAWTTKPRKFVNEANVCRRPANAYALWRLLKT